MYGMRRLGNIELRRVPAIDAALDAIAVCAERGRPLLITPGGIGFAGIYLAARPYVSWLPSIMELVKYLAEKAGEAGVRIISVNTNPFGKMQTVDFTIQGYVKAGHPELFREEDHIFFPDYIAGVPGTIGIIHDEKPAAAIMIGSHAWYSSVSIAEAARIEGAYTIGGTPFPDDTCGVCIAADYVVFSEEVVAMGTYLSDDPVDKSILVGEDIFKIFLIGLMFVLFGVYSTGVL